MTAQEARAFNEWLRGQLKAKKMSQRQLAQQAGVDHSTISRLVRGDRTPSLDTATRLARGLREIRDDEETPAYFGHLSNGTASPPARVEYALRSDDLLAEPHVRQVMEYYLAIRMRQAARAGMVPRSPMSNRPPGGVRSVVPVGRPPVPVGRYPAPGRPPAARPARPIPFPAPSSGRTAPGRPIPGRPAPGRTNSGRGSTEAPS
jgi:transcriptional regulator with XRE-family HTH domain